MSNVGIIGETVMTNGTNGAYHEVRTERVRLRLLNASLARTYNFAMAGPDDQLREYQLIGTDGGLLPAPATVRTGRLSPGERAEIVVQIPPGRTTPCAACPWTWAPTRGTRGSLAGTTGSTCSNCALRPP